MKRLIPALFLILSFAACKDEPANPPTATLNGMFAAMKNGNIEEMKKYITKTDVAMLEAAEKFLTATDPESVPKIKAKMMEKMKEGASHVQYSLSNEKIDGDKATVDAEITVKDTASQDGKKVSKQTFELVKEDNSWKIALSRPGNEMFNSMKGNMGKRDGDMKDGLEKLQKMNPDSLKLLIKKGLQALDSMDIQKKEH